MNSPLALIALCAGALCLGACDRTPTVDSTAKVSQPSAAASGVAEAPVADPSLPPAASVFPAPAAASDAAPARTDGTRNTTQDARTTPMPGQNNDHSAPLATAGRSASAP